MPIVRGPLDSSLKDRIAHPSQDFSDFLNQYFLTPQIYGRGEHDITILDRLKGEERETAIEMIAANLRSGCPHLVDSIVQLDLKNAIPTLESMRADEYDEYEQYIIARALHMLGAMDSEAFYSVVLDAASKCSDLLAFILFEDAYRLFTEDKARTIIDSGLHSDDYSVRASAFRAAVALQYIAAKGGRFSVEIASDLWKMQMGAATEGAPPPMYYEQLQYYVGDVTYADSALFERHLAELWNASKRKMPLYTEVGQKH